MNRTPLEIQSKEFSRRFRGYDIEEVKEYLN
ncbi:MAG TPA: DivIVA domain-containing protein, partial [bacterium]|nr:DivIVA domain-containing protein [bacterium]